MGLYRQPPARGYRYALTLALAVTLAAPAGGVAARPTGFADTGRRPEAPNTVAGVLRNAASSDYVLLYGSLQTGDDGYVFTDRAGDALRVSFPEQAGPRDLIPGNECYLWGQVERSPAAVTLRGLILDPR